MGVYIYGKTADTAHWENSVCKLSKNFCFVVGGAVQRVPASSE